MSWSLLLLKQVPKNWTTQLPADDPTQWAQLIRFHSLTQDKEGNKNIPLDNDAFINDIKSGSYPQKGIRGTIKQLEEWKENPKRYISTEGPHPDAKYWETKQQWAPDAPNLTISYFE